MSAIGLGDFLETIIISFIFLILVIILIILLKNKKYFISLLISSIFLNLISFLFFLGESAYLSYINVFFWPIINIFLIIYYVRKEK